MRGQKQKYPVALSEAEVEQLTQVVERGKHSRREIQRAQMLLWSAEGKTDVEIAAFSVGQSANSGNRTGTVGKRKS